MAGAGPPAEQEQLFGGMAADPAGHTRKAPFGLWIVMRCSESIVAGVRIGGATFLGDLVFSIIPWFDAPPLAKP